MVGDEVFKTTNDSSVLGNVVGSFTNVFGKGEEKIFIDSGVDADTGWARIASGAAVAVNDEFFY